MYWKYAFKPKDAVQFRYRGHLAWGTFKGWVKNDAFQRVHEEESYENVEPSDFDIVVNSGGEEIRVNLDEVNNRVKFEDRKSDLPNLGEEFRFSKGVKQIDRKIEKGEIEEVSQ